MPFPCVSDGRELLSLDRFLSMTEGADRELMPLAELDKFLPVCCGMANGAGGWIAVGLVAADLDEVGTTTIDAVDVIPDVSALVKHLREQLSDRREISCDPAEAFYVLRHAGREFPLVKIRPADWFLRPVCVGGDYVGGTYRRVNGENVLSGLNTRFRLAMDALENERCGVVCPGKPDDLLDSAATAEFVKIVRARTPLWAGLSLESVLRRALVLDENGKVTEAGRLLLGKKVEPISFNGSHRRFANIWSAQTELLPMLTEGLAPLCADAVKECFFNALLHADHDTGSVEVRRCGAELSFTNPGFPRTFVPGESVARNYRLLRIFIELGWASGAGHGLGIVRAFAPYFRLTLDTLELRTVAVLPLIPAIAPSPSDKAVTAPETRPLLVLEHSLSGWETMFARDVKKNLLAEIGGVRQADKTTVTQAQEEAPATVDEEPAAVETGLIDAQEQGLEDLAVMVEEQLADKAAVTPIQEEATAVAVEKPSSEAPSAAQKTERTVSKTEEPSVEQWSPLVQEVREVPKISATLVRRAILELCARYRSLDELSALLLRSPSSLRRHYMTSMVQEGLLEMEFPERVGHPKQRYRVIE